MLDRLREVMCQVALASDQGDQVLAFLAEAVVVCDPIFPANSFSR
jgi:hypothetical protein